MISSIKATIFNSITKILERYNYKVIPKTDKVKIAKNPFSDQKKLIQNIINPIIFDVGGHWGETAIIYSKLIENAKVYTFEPFPESFQLLQDNVKEFKNIIPIKSALGNQKGTVEFHVNKRSGTNSLLPLDERGASVWGDYKIENIGKEIINITRLDDFVEENKIEKINILKIDVQGSEHDVIKGADQSIKNGKIDLIYVEMILMPTYENQKSMDETLVLLKERGYKLFNFYNESLTKEGQLRQVDAIFYFDKN